MGDTQKKTVYGTIHFGGPCKDDYANINRDDIDGEIVKLQGPALRAYRDCVKKRGRPIHISGSWRSCAYQAELYKSDPNRYAPPDKSLHCRGLAIDVINPVPDEVRRILLHNHWFRPRDDEPWHFSFGVSG